MTELREMPSSLNDACRKLDLAYAEITQLRTALYVAREYLSLSLGSPSYKGPNPYPIIAAALGVTALSPTREELDRETPMSYPRNGVGG